MSNPSQEEIDTVKLDPSNPKYVLNADENVQFYTEEEDIWESHSIDIFPLQASQIKEVPVSDLKILHDYKNVFRIILKLVDFRMLLTLGIVNKEFKDMAESEILRRRNFITENKFFWSDTSFWYVGARCGGYTTYTRTKVLTRPDPSVGPVIVNTDPEILALSVDDVHLKMNIFIDKRPCCRWEEIVEYGKYALCRSCIRSKARFKKVESETYNARCYEYKSSKNRAARILYNARQATNHQTGRRKYTSKNE